MDPGPFHAILDQGEDIIWLAQGRPAKRNWLAGLLLGVIAFVLLGVSGLAFLLIWLPFSLDFGPAYVIQVIGLGNAFRDTVILVLGMVALWGTVRALHRRAGGMYGLSKTRAFACIPGRGRQADVGAYAIDISAPVKAVAKDGFCDLTIPIQQRPGQGQEWVWFERLSPADCEAALNLLKKTLGGAA